jgi:hypothetical protein
MKMTKIQVYLNDGNIISSDVDTYNADELAAKMNDQRLLMVCIGNVVVNKTIIKYISPVTVAQ